jgi:hypothetical protein
MKEDNKIRVTAILENKKTGEEEEVEGWLNYGIGKWAGITFDSGIVKAVKVKTVRLKK